MVNFRAQAISYLNAAVIVLALLAGIYAESEGVAAPASGHGAARAAP